MKELVCKNTISQSESSNHRVISLAITIAFFSSLLLFTGYYGHPAFSTSLTIIGLGISPWIGLFLLVSMPNLIHSYLNLRLQKRLNTFKVSE